MDLALPPLPHPLDLSSPPPPPPPPPPPHPLDLSSPPLDLRDAIVVRVSTSSVAVTLFYCCKGIFFFVTLGFFFRCCIPTSPLDLDLRDTMVAKVPMSSITVSFVTTVVVASFCCCTSIFLCCISSWCFSCFSIIFQLFFCCDNMCQGVSTSLSQCCNCCPF